MQTIFTEYMKFLVFLMLDFSLLYLYHVLMILKDWRKKERLSQVKLAAMLSQHARELGKSKKLSQRTISTWELGVTPRKFWFSVIASFTKNEVMLSDFLAPAVCEGISREAEATWENLKNNARK